MAFQKQTPQTWYGINNTAQLREQGLIQFQFIKTRNSGGVGRTIDMEYDVETLKISDLPVYQSSSGSHQAPSFKGSKLGQLLVHQNHQMLGGKVRQSKHY